MIQKLLKKLSAFILLICFLPAPAKAMDINLGIAGVEEGDDRPRPAASLGISFGTHDFWRSYIYGRNMDLVKELTIVSGVGYKFLLLKKKHPLTACIGASFIQEQTTIEPVTSTSEKLPETHNNFGAVFGLSYRIGTKHLKFEINWESHLYFAGVSGILLVTGRKQMLGLNIGYMF